jgi:hypothetical protein
VNDADRQDAPIMKQTDENITDIRGLVWSDWHLTFRMIAD